MSAEYPPSALYVLDVVRRDGPITRAELLERTGLSSRTADRALRQLREDGLVETTSSSGDLRYRVYAAE